MTLVSVNTVERFEQAGSEPGDEEREREPWEEAETDGRKKSAEGEM